MFTRYRYYRHINSLDCDIFIHKICLRGDQYWEMDVTWWQRHGNYEIGPDKIKIKRKDFKNWKLVK